MTHDHAETCPLCPTPAELAAMGERNLAAAKTRREALLAEIDANPALFVHVVEGFDVNAMRETITLHVASTIELARRYCATYRLSNGQACEIRPFRIDGGKRDGNEISDHYVKVDGTVVHGEGRYYPPRD